MTVGVTVSIFIMPLPIVAATTVPKIRNATKLKKAAQMTACFGDRTLRGNYGGNGICRIVHAVGKIEDQCDSDDDDNKYRHYWISREILTSKDESIRNSGCILEPL